MEIQIHDRSHDVSAEERSHAEEKLAAVAAHSEFVERAELEFDRDLRRRPNPLHVVKVTLWLRGHRMPNLRAHESGSELRTVVDRAMDKIDRELSHLKERIKTQP